jgi:hypothetical protein
VRTYRNLTQVRRLVLPAAGTIAVVVVLLVSMPAAASAGTLQGARAALPVLHIEPPHPHVAPPHPMRADIEPPHPMFAPQLVRLEPPHPPHALQPAAFALPQPPHARA